MYDEKRDIATLLKNKVFMLHILTIYIITERKETNK